MRWFLIAVMAATVIGFGSGPVFAASVGGQGGFVSGVLHPVLGFDHLLAMIAVGLLSVQIGGRAVWTVPAAFVVALGLGGAIGLMGYPLPQVEGFIALSVLALGLAIALQAAMPVFFGMLFVALFALFHGHAHGVEAPRLADPLAYAGGFMLASAALHLLGVALGLLQQRMHARALLGAGVAGIGMHMVLLTYEVI